MADFYQILLGRLCPFQTYVVKPSAETQSSEETC